MRPLTQTETQLLERYVDGELSPADAAQAEALLESEESAREHVAAVEELRMLVRAPVEHAMTAVDFDALARRIDEAVAVEALAAQPERASAQAPASAGFFARFIEAIGGRTVLASAATAVIVVLVMLPFTNRGGGGEAVQIHNHYYELAPAETVGYEWETIEKGYNGTFTPGDKAEDMAPVIWISPGSGEGDFEKVPPVRHDPGSANDTSL